MATPTPIAMSTRPSTRAKSSSSPLRWRSSAPPSPRSFRKRFPRHSCAGAAGLGTRLCRRLRRRLRQSPTLARKRNRLLWSMTMAVPMRMAMAMAMRISIPIPMTMPVPRMVPSWSGTIATTTGVSLPPGMNGARQHSPATDRGRLPVPTTTTTTTATTKITTTMKTTKKITKKIMKRWRTPMGAPRRRIPPRNLPETILNHPSHNHNRIHHHCNHHNVHPRPNSSPRPPKPQFFSSETIETTMDANPRPDTRGSRPPNCATVSGRPPAPMPPDPSPREMLCGFPTTTSSSTTSTTTSCSNRLS
mmetsp:Transcript_2232/g.5987  ORF Transcript_2232/g.5987 Transcript_2232/m.5987 type:complete len:304 (+) Transcript_2232:78-989(+)